MTAAAGMDKDALSSRTISAVQLLLTLLFSCWVLSPNFSAQFGVIDDHEVIGFLGREGSLRFADILDRLKGTEVWLPNVHARYRPAYYLLRLIETALWGKSAFCWYAVRVALFWGTTFISWRLCMRFAGTVLGGICALLLFSNSYWADIFARLGPGETYCAAALALYSLAFLRLWQTEGEGGAGWWGVLCVSGIVCMGSKENFLLLLPVPSALCLRLHVQGRLTRSAAAVSAAFCAFGVFVAAVIVNALHKGGVDVYRNPVTPAARLTALWTALSSSRSAPVLAPFLDAAALVLLLLVLSRLPRGGPRLLAKAKQLLLAESLLAALVLSQIVFYNGVWPTGMRYDLPGMLAVEVAYLILFFSVASVLCDLYLSQSKYARLAPSLITAVLILVYFAATGAGEIGKLHDAALENSVATRRYQSALHTIVAATRTKPAVPLVLEANSTTDFEPVSSLRTYLKSCGVSNPTVIVNSFSAAAAGGLQESLGGELGELSKNGGGATPCRDPLFPARIIEGRKDYFVVTFSGGSRLPGTTICRVW